jgi:hypothetical protein
LFILILLFLAAITIIAEPALAWDITSHNAISQAAVSKIPFFNQKIDDEAIGDIIVDWSQGNKGEAIHSMTSDGELLVGSNDGNNYPDHLWQSVVEDYRAWQNTGNDDYRKQAYQHLGQLVHAIEDQGCPPHAWSIRHGPWYNPKKADNLEYLALITTPYSLYRNYYEAPWALTTHDGKNILDTSDHLDEEWALFELKRNTYEWTPVLSTNLQTPAATTVNILVTLQKNLLSFPDHVSLRITYDTTHGQVTQYTEQFAPSIYEETKFVLSDDFAPNGEIRVDYKREEGGYYDPDCLIQVRVMNTKDVADGLEKPSLDHPWEYYNWMRDWTQKNTAAPYWRRYWNLGSYGDLQYNVVYAPNTELALLTQQWAASEQAVYWFLLDAQQKLDETDYTIDQARGNGIRVVTYEAANYNTADPEYLYCQPIVYERDLYADGQPMLDNNFHFVADNGGWASIQSDYLGYMANRISSIDIRGGQALKVVLYSGPRFTGESRTLFDEDDVADLSVTPYNFDDKTVSMKIMWDPYPPSSGTYALSGPVNDEGWYNTDMVTLNGASDDGSGLAKIVYRLDSDENWTDYAGPFHLDDGVHTLSFQAVDNAGNVGSRVTAVIKVDTSAPQTRLNLSINSYGWANTDLIGLNASDNGSDINKTSYKLDAGDWVVYTEPFTVSEGNHALLFKSVDKSGNAETEKSASFRVDVTKPVVTLRSPGMAQYYLDDTVSWDWTVADAVSGVLSQNGPWIGSSVDTNTPGEHTYAITASDRAGNSITRIVTYTVKAAPTVVPTPTPVVTPAPVPTVMPAPTPGAVSATPTTMPSSPTPVPVAPSTEKSSLPGNLWLIPVAIGALAIIGVWLYTRRR